MNRVQLVQLVFASVLAVAVFVAYQSFYGDERNQAYASLRDGGQQVERLNYKPAQKREARSRLGSDVDNLLEFKGHDIVQVFDAPELVRRDLPTTVWQYRNDFCVMDVYFTVGRAGDVARENVAHYEVRSRDAKGRIDITANDCLSGMVDGGSFVSLLDVSAFLKSGS